MRHLSILAILTLSFVACNNNSQWEKANGLNGQAEAAMDAEEYQAALNHASEALEIFQSIQDSLGISTSYYLMARSSAFSEDFDNAVKNGEAGSQFCKGINNYPLEYRINSILSWAYFTQGRDFYETMEHQQRQLLVVDELDDEEAKAMVYNNYGYDGTVSGGIPLTEAIEYTKFANDHYARTENNQGRWYTLMNLTWQHRLINDLKKSEEYGRLAVEQARIDNDRHAIIEAATNLGETLLFQNKTAEAKPFYELGLELRGKEADRDKYVFDVYYSRYLWETGEKEEAISSLKSAIDFLENDEVFYEMLARAFLADYSYSTGNLDDARKQVEIFKNPRASYFSQESGVIASMVDAQLVSATNREKALAILDDQLRELDKSGAEFLEIRLLELRDEI